MKARGKNVGYQLICFADERGLAEMEWPIGAEASTAATGPGQKPEVHILAMNGIAALYQEVDIDMFTGETGDSNMGDLNWLLPRITHHQEITANLHKHSTVLPVRFGALYSSKRRLEDFMAHNRSTIVTALDRLRRKGEWDLKISYRQQQATEKVLTELLAKEAGSLAELAPGKRYFLERKIGQQAKDQTDQAVQAMLRKIAQVIGDLPEEAVQLPLNDELGQHGEQTVAHQALLVDVSQYAMLQQKHLEVNAQYKEAGIAVELNGPWPPYSFCPELDPLVD